MNKSFVRSTVIAILLLLPQSLAFSQENNIENPLDGFAKIGDDYPEAQVPMTVREHQLFVDITGLLIQAQTREPNTQGYLPNVNSGSLLSVKVNNKGNILVNLDKNLIGDHWGVEIEDFLDLLRYEVQDVARKRVKNVGSVLFVFNGKEPLSYDPPIPPDNSQSDLAPLAIPGTVVLSAGHGIYFNYQYNDWRPHSDPSNGITEDYLTPRLASILDTFLKSRSKATTYLARQATNSPEIHEPSNKPWWQISARYYLQKLLPTHKEIWHSLPNATYSLREYDEDIRSRPFYANYLNAATLLSIHTNAPGASASGTKIFYNSKPSTGASSLKLAKSISCYMDELITAVDKYQSFKVWQPEILNNKGEIGHAKMPAVIVEVAFHSNPSDALALQDPKFQQAAMKGVEKGLRLFNQNQPCKHFDIASVGNATGHHNKPIPVKVNYAGFPQFAVKAQIKVVSCPSGWTCSGGTVTYNKNTPSPLMYNFTCHASNSHPAATFGLQTTLFDLDGVKTSIKSSSVTCTPSAAAASPTANQSKSAYITFH